MYVEVISFVFTIHQTQGGVEGLLLLLLLDMALHVSKV